MGGSRRGQEGVGGDREEASEARQGKAREGLKRSKGCLLCRRDVLSDIYGAMRREVKGSKTLTPCPFSPSLPSTFPPPSLSQPG